MYQSGQLVCEDFLCLVQLCTFPVIHRLDLLKRQEGQHTDALEHVCIIDIAPVLIEIVRRSLIRIEPNCAGSGLAHLLALGVEQQSDGHRVRVLAQLAADQLCTAEHVAPLVVAAELHVAAVVLEQVVEVVGLHRHVVELEEAQTLLHALLEALGTEHIINREARADVADKLDVVEVHQPVGVIYHLRLALTEFDEALHLLLEAVAVVLDGLDSHHRAHIGTAGRVADHSGAAADQRDRLVACHLHALHQAERHKVANMQAVRGRIEADVEGCLAVVDHLADLFFVRYLRDQTARFQFVVKLHYSVSCISICLIFMIKRVRIPLRSTLFSAFVYDYHGFTLPVRPRRAVPLRCGVLHPRFPRRRADVQFRLRGVLCPSG